MADRRDWTRETLAAGVRTGDRRALARAITLVENGDPLAYGLVADLAVDHDVVAGIGQTGRGNRSHVTLSVHADLQLTGSQSDRLQCPQPGSRA